MAQYLEKVRLQVSSLAYFSISYIPRSKHAKADSLSCLATSVGGVLGDAYIKRLERPSIKDKKEVLSLV